MDTLTSITLLEGLKNGQDVEAWQRFINRYEPMVLALAIKMGLRDSDAHDACQETMMAFVQTYRQGRYDRSKGRLRTWLFGIAYRKIIDLQRRSPREKVVSDQTDATAFLNTIPSQDESQAIWEKEWQRAVIDACVQEVSQSVNTTTLSAFKLTVLQQWPVERTAKHLGITENAVYIAKTRVMTRMREIQKKMEEIW